MIFELKKKYIVLKMFCIYATFLLNLKLKSHFNSKVKETTSCVHNKLEKMNNFSKKIVHPKNVKNERLCFPEKKIIAMK